MNIVLLGSGNVATHLKNVLLKKEEISIIQWYSRHFNEITSNDGISLTGKLANIKQADLYLLAVSDDAIPALSSQLPEGSFAAHTAGSVSIEALKNKGSKGIFYPLQSFSKKRTANFSEIPICLEADTPEGLSLLKALGNVMHAPLHFIDSEQRLALHTAAVFANNFTNHLYRVAEDICLKNKVSFNLLKPLILETANKINVLSPLEAQTGPAKRNDKTSFKKHLDFLDSKAHQELYATLTKAIQQNDE